MSEISMIMHAYKVDSISLPITCVMRLFFRVAMDEKASTHRDCDMGLTIKSLTSPALASSKNDPFV